MPPNLKNGVRKSASDPHDRENRRTSPFTGRSIAPPHRSHIARAIRLRREVGWCLDSAIGLLGFSDPGYRPTAYAQLRTAAAPITGRCGEAATTQAERRRRTAIRQRSRISHGAFHAGRPAPKGSATVQMFCTRAMRCTANNPHGIPPSRASPRQSMTGAG